MKYTLNKQEKLKSKKLIEELFLHGDSVKLFPLRLTYLQKEHTSSYPAQAAFSVPKRNFKLAVDRNRVKRLLREVYRKEKYTVYNSVTSPFVYMITFMGKKEPKYSDLESKMKQLLEKFLAKIETNQP